MNKKVLWSVVVVVIIIIVAAVSMNKKAAQVTDTGDIKIGAILNLTGTFADQGENSRNGIILATEEINKAGGVMGRQITINFQDNQGDNPQGALTALNSLTAQSIRLIIGPNLTPSGNVVSPVLEKADAVMIAPSVGSEKFAEQSPRAFNVFPPNKFDSIALADYIYKKGIKKIAIFGSQQEWESDQANFVKKEFEKIGGTVTSMQLPTVDNKDLKTEASKIKSSNPDAIVFTNYGETAVAARRLKSIGVNVPFFSVLLYDPQVADAQGALEGTIFVTTDTTNNAFNAKYKARFNKDQGITTMQAYDALNLMALAIKNAGSTDTKAVTKALSDIKIYDGASGNLSFDPDGNAHKPERFYQVKNNKFVEL